MTSLGKLSPARQFLAGTMTDNLLLLLSLAGIAAAWFIIHTSIGAGPPTAYIYHGDILLATYPLPEDDRIIHFDADGEIGTSEIIIDRLGARMAHSPCPTQYCVLSGAHKHIGDQIACVPNHILISIRGGDKQGGLDAVAE